MRAFKFLSIPFVLATLAAPAVAQDNPTLTVYTYDAFAAEWGPGPGLKSGFEAQCDCILDFVAVDSSISALRRAQLEGEQTKADIILGLDTSIAGQAAATGLFAEHNVDTSALTLPRAWASPLFVPFDYGYFAFVYDKTRLPEPPTSLERMALHSNDLKIVIQDPRASTPGLGLVLWLKAAYGEDTVEAWPDIAEHVVTMTRSWSDAYALFLKGEADMVLSYTTSPAYHLIAEEDDRFAAAPFREGHYAQIEVAGILQSSPNQDLARQFLAYLISPEAQKLIPTTNWMYPVADIGPLPDGFDTLFVPEKVLLLDDDLVETQSRAWIEEALGAFN